MNLIDLAWYFLPFFVFVYGWNAFKDFKTGRVNSIAFAMLNGMLYVGFFVLQKNILFGLMLTIIFLLMLKFSEKFVQFKFFSIGDFSMLLPFSMLTYLFLDIFEMILAYVILFFAGFVWLSWSKSKSFCPPVFFTILLVFVRILFFG